MTLKELKHKYSGQAIPEWELVKAGLKQSDTVEKRGHGRPKKVVVEEDGDSDTNS